MAWEREHIVSSFTPAATVDELASYLIKSYEYLESQTDDSALYKGIDVPDTRKVCIRDGAGCAYLVDKDEKDDNMWTQGGMGLIPTIIRVFDNQTQKFKVLRNWGPATYPDGGCAGKLKSGNRRVYCDEVRRKHAEFWQTEYDPHAPGPDLSDEFIGLLKPEILTGRAERDLRECGLPPPPPKVYAAPLYDANN
jgi:hypothetical protein